MEATVFATAPNLSVVPHFPSSYQRNNQRIALPYLNRTVYISVDDILCLQGEGNYTYLHTRDRKRFLVSKTLKEFEKTLDETIFLRIHKSYMVNLAYVQRHLFSHERQLRLADGREVAISRRRMKDITLRLTQFWQRLYN